MSINDQLKMTLKDISVLCVEDETFSLQFLTEILKQKVKEVYTARDGREGLYAYSRFSPDVVITDIEMPRLSGLDMAGSIRDADPDAIIVLATGFDSIENLKQAISLHLDEFISKPVNPEEIVKALENCLRKLNIRQERSRHEKFTETMLGSMPFPVMLVNVAESRVETANPAARAMGYDQGGALHAPLFNPEIISLMRKKTMPSRLFTSAGEQVSSVETHEKKWEIYLKPVGPENIIFAAVDVTWRKQMEKLREDVERITRHDLKTPLNGILAIPDLLLESTNLDDEERRLLGYIKDSGLTMLNMVNLSLDLYKMEQGTYELAAQPVNLFQVIKKVIVQMDQLERGKQLRVKILTSLQPAGENETLEVMGEELLCYSMLSNLIKNAMEASPAQEDITINLEKVMDTVMISIHNQGTVPEEIRENFFDKMTTHGKKSGTGLGTYSARLMASTMHGHIEMETSPEHGTRLNVYLPIKEKQTQDL